MKASISLTGFAGERCYLVIAGEVEIRVLHTGATKEGHCSIAVGGGEKLEFSPQAPLEKQILLLQVGGRVCV